MIDDTKLVRRAPTRPLVWLGERTPASDVAPLGARFPAFLVKEGDLILDLPTRQQR